MRLCDQVCWRSETSRYLPHILSVITASLPPSPPLARSNNLGVVKLAPNLSVMETWNISFTGDSHAKDGDMIIVCGVLYGIKSRTEINTKFRWLGLG